MHYAGKVPGRRHHRGARPAGPGAALGSEDDEDRQGHPRAHQRRPGLGDGEGLSAEGTRLLCRVSHARARARRVVPISEVTLCFRCDGFHDVFTVIRMAKWKPSTDAALFSH